MGTICHNLLAPRSQADSLQRIATKQCLLALATTFFGVGNAQQSLVSDGRRLYGQALKMVNVTISDSSLPELTEILSSVVSLCLHKVPPRGNFQLITFRLGNYTNESQRPLLDAPRLWS
jgi:hypothetical protein